VISFIRWQQGLFYFSPALYRRRLYLYCRLRSCAGIAQTTRIKKERDVDVFLFVRDSIYFIGKAYVQPLK
jgi:hypothetical protein